MVSKFGIYLILIALIIETLLASYWKYKYLQIKQRINEESSD
jgi:hypothetical protein